MTIIDCIFSSVCHSNTSGYRCVCEEQYAWPHDSCVTYGACDEFSDGTCGCIKGLPADRQFCQRGKHAPPAPTLLAATAARAGKDTLK